MLTKGETMEIKELMKRIKEAHPKVQLRTLKTQSVILHHSIDLFGEYGFRNTSIRDIADAAGVKNQVIGYHFGTKEELWIKCVSLLWNKFAQSTTEFKIDPENPRASYTAHIRSIILRQIEQPHLMRMVFYETMLGSPQFEFIKEHIFTFSQILKNELKMGIDAGIIKDLPLNDLYFIYGNAINMRYMTPGVNELISGTKNDDPAAIDSHINSILELFFVPECE